MTKQAQSRKNFESEFVAIYCRVSTVRQGVEGVSLEIQRQKCVMEADLRFPNLKRDVFMEVASGRRDRREQYNHMMENLRKGKYAAVIAWDVDRLSRCTSDFHRFLDQINKYDTELILHSIGLISTTAYGKLLLGILSVTAQFESDHLAVRMKEVHRAARQEGKKGPGSRPFGWKEDGSRNLIEHPDEQKILSLCAGMRSRGRTWTEICKDVVSLGVKPVLGGDWDPKKLRGCVMAGIKRRERNLQNQVNLANRMHTTETQVS